MEKLISVIREADNALLDKLIAEIIKRKNQLNPTDELVVLVLPRKDKEERKRIVERAVDCFFVKDNASLLFTNLQ